MPAHKKPTELLRLSGALAHDPARYADRGDNPEPKAPIGPAPAHLTPEQADVYNRIVELMPDGVLGDADEFIVELAAKLIHRSRAQWELLKAADLNNLTVVLGKLGLTPSDRTKLSVPKTVKEKPEDPWTKF